MNDKLALVFGGSRGIGAATVAALADDGYRVGSTHVGMASTEAVNGGQIRNYRVEISSRAEVAQVFADFRRDFGAPPSCVVANAGINVPPGPIAEFDADSFRRLVEINIIGAFNVLQHAAREVADGGAIIALSTSMVRTGPPGMGAYTATKGAVECLVRSLARELAGRGVRVNAVAPGPVDTDLFRAGKDEAALARSAALSPFNRVGQPEEIARVIRFLASPGASWVSGQVVQPNGGMV